MKLRVIYSFLFVGFTVSCATVSGKQDGPQYHQSEAVKASGEIYDSNFLEFQPLYAQNGIVVSESKLASEVGEQVLKRGGNAIDAAVAVGFVLAVVYPNAGNIGGGGFMMSYNSKNHRVEAIDFREVAPQSASKETYLDQRGNVIDQKSIDTPFASGVPGTVKGLETAWQRGGHLPWASLLAPAIELADKGFIITRGLGDRIRESEGRLSLNKATWAIYAPKGRLLQAGDRFVQKDLARTLRLIATGGSNVFYQGEIADKIARSMAPYHWMSKQDLANYRVVIRKPLIGTFKGYTVTVMPPPSSGGVHILQILNVLEHFPLEQWGQNSAKTIHYMSEAMKWAYADRSKYLGDPDYVKVPVKGLTAKAYAATIAQKIGEKSTPVSAIAPGVPQPYESNETTHISTVDKEGNAVAMTYTLNDNFGNGFTVPGTGILMNNEMDDFSLKPGEANLYGLIGAEANEVKGGKRPLSSMSPTFVFKDKDLYLVTGTPGGARILTTVLQIIVDDLLFHLNPAEAIAAPRFHEQWLPDEIRVEKGLSPDTIHLLQEKGHTVRVKAVMGKVGTIRVTHDQKGQQILEGAADPRNPDGAVVGY